MVFKHFLSFFSLIKRVLLYFSPFNLSPSSYFYPSHQLHIKLVQPPTIVPSSIRGAVPPTLEGTCLEGTELDSCYKSTSIVCLLKLVFQKGSEVIKGFFIDKERDKSIQTQIIKCLMEFNTRNTRLKFCVGNNQEMMQQKKKQVFF